MHKMGLRKGLLGQDCHLFFEKEPQVQEDPQIAHQLCLNLFHSELKVGNLWIWEHWNQHMLRFVSIEMKHVLFHLPAFRLWETILTVSPRQKCTIGYDLHFDDTSAYVDRLPHLTTSCRCWVGSKKEWNLTHPVNDNGKKWIKKKYLYFCGLEENRIPGTFFNFLKIFSRNNSINRI